MAAGLDDILTVDMFEPPLGCHLIDVYRCECSSAFANFASSMAFSLLATTTAATPLPTRLVSARASDMKRSMPRMSAMEATGMVPALGERRGQHDEARAGDAGGALRRQEQNAEDAELLPERQIGIRRLRQEQRCHGEINARAVEVERVAGRE